MKNLRNLSNVSQDLRKGLSDFSEQLKEPKSESDLSKLSTQMYLLGEISGMWVSFQQYMLCSFQTIGNALQGMSQNSGAKFLTKNTRDF